MNQADKLTTCKPDSQALKGMGSVSTQCDPPLVNKPELLYFLTSDFLNSWELPVPKCIMFTSQICVQIIQWSLYINDSKTHK